MKKSPKELIEIAYENRKNAYAPYSNFLVGAALLTTDGEVFGGCNIENAAFTPGNCAERTAGFKAVSEGKKSFAAIAVVGGKAGETISQLCAPCGVCRQVLREFCDPETFILYLTDGKEIFSYKLEELLPLSFGADNL